MKHFILIAILLFSITATQAQEEKVSRKERKATEKEEARKRTENLIESKNWMFEARHMLPSRGPSRPLTTYYGVIFKDNELESFLPFFGRAYRADYGSMKSPLDFTSEVDSYSIEKWKKGGWIIKISLRNKIDVLNYVFTIGDNGTASLDLSSTDREHISYQGEIIEIPKEENN